MPANLRGIAFGEHLAFVQHDDVIAFLSLVRIGSADDDRRPFFPHELPHDFP